MFGGCAPTTAFTSWLPMRADGAPAGIGALATGAGAPTSAGTIGTGGTEASAGGAATWPADIARWPGARRAAGEAGTPETLRVDMWPDSAAGVNTSASLDAPVDAG